jgi:small subunit ribosomal protein S21
LVGIVVSENEPIDRAIKRFKKKYERSGVLKEFKKRAYFTKPSVKKRMKKVKAIRRALRTLAEQTRGLPHYSKARREAGLVRCRRPLLVSTPSASTPPPRPSWSL